MLDKISGLFRRKQPDTKATPHKAPAVAPAPVDPAIAQAQTARLEEATRLLDNNPSAADALRIARDELPAELRCRALAHVNDNNALRDIALGDKVARVRLAAAERLSAADDLELLRRNSSDKAVQRHARDALKAVRDAEKAAQEAQARITHLLTAISQHAHRAFEPLYDAKLESLEAGWHAVAAQASAAEQERFAELAALARDTVQKHAAEIHARQQAIAAKQELIAACNEMETIVSQLQREDLSSSLASVAAIHATQETRWQEAASLATVDAPLEKRFHSALQTLGAWLNAAAELPRVGQDASALLGAIAASIADKQEISDDQLDDWQHTLDALQSRCHWPDGLQQPALIGELAAARRHVRQLEKARQQDRQQQLAQLRKRRHGLKRMIDEGQLRAATRSMAWLQKRIAELPAADAASEVAALAPVAEALQRLHDWYEFASVPKKTELCERIEKLAATTLTTTLAAAAADVSARAEQVRELREQWNLLCAADPEADPELRARFNTAAGLAHEPCATWYAEQHRIQDENLARRAALCDELAALLAGIDAGSTDWKALEQRERDARALWKSIEPVRWPDARATQDRFTALIGELRKKLDGERHNNAGQREALIAQAQALLAQEPLETAINAAKRLQESWKSIGFSDPREDRRQWQTFRAALDAVFARRDAARDAERMARDAAQAEAARLREEQARQQAEEQQRRLARIEEQKQARRSEVESALALAAAESRWLAGESVDTGELAAVIDALPKSRLVAALKARIEKINRDERPDATTLAALGETLATLTLDLEIAHDIASPPAFADIRMKRKIEKLNSALRGNKDKDAADAKADTLVNVWLATGPVAGSERDALRARIAVLLNA